MDENFLKRARIVAALDDRAAVSASIDRRKQLEAVAGRDAVQLIRDMLAAEDDK